MRDEHGTGDAAVQVERALWLYALVVVAVTVGSWVVYSHYATFDRRPLFSKIDQFHDLTNYVGKTAHLFGGSAELGRGLPVFNYPPVAAFVYKALLHSVPGHPVLPYIVILSVSVTVLAFVGWRACGGSGDVRLAAGAALAVTAGLGYPLWFTADRGNLEGAAWALAAAGLCFLLRARYRTAAVLIGLAASIKPFPILFLLLMVRRKKFKEALLGVATTVVVTLIALVVLGPNPWTAYKNLRPGQAFYVDHYLVHLMSAEEGRFSHSLLDGMKTAALSVEMHGFHATEAPDEIAMLNQRPGGWHVARALARAYPFVALPLFGFLVWVFYDKPLLNQLTALACAVTLFPPSAGDYTLLHLYVPFGALVVFLVREVATGKAKFSYAAMLGLAVIYALLFAPLTPLRIYAGDAKLLLLLALLVVAARSPMWSEYFGSPTDDEPASTGSAAGLDVSR